jgi:RimJ/RimL family protein N-acetyltransferase
VTAIPELRTERLLLRGFREDDLDDWAEFCADPEVMRWIGHEHGIDRGQAWRDIALQLGHWELRGYGMFAVEELGSGSLVGRVGPWEPEGWPELEVGWAIGRPWWGRGYAPEAARASALWAFEQRGVDSVISLIAEANDKSQRVAEKLGSYPDGWGTVHGNPVRVFRLDRGTLTPS